MVPLFVMVPTVDVINKNTDMQYHYPLDADDGATVRNGPDGGTCININTDMHSYHPLMAVMVPLFVMVPTEELSSISIPYASSSPAEAVMVPLFVMVPTLELDSRKIPTPNHLSADVQKSSRH